MNQYLNQYSIFTLPDNKYKNITKQYITKNYSAIQNRDFRLFTNNISSEISLLLFRENLLLLKFDVISVIMSPKNCIFFKFNTVQSNNFIYYISKINTINSISFSMNIFERILIYLSQQSDNFLEKTSNQISKFSIQTTGQHELLKIITLHILFYELNNIKNIESLKINRRSFFFVIFNNKIYLKSKNYQYL